nr:formate--tetrahydrofolate ligase [Acidobacteriota bacterium]
NDSSLNNLKRGLANLEKHLENLRRYKVPVVVAINRFTADTDEEIAAIRDFCREANVESSVVEVYNKGGEGAMDLAAKVMAIADASDAEKVAPLYPAELGLEEKVELVAREIYGAGAVYFDSEARKKLKKFTVLGFGQLPVCIAKTPSSLSDNPKVLGAPRGWTLTATDAHLSAGAGFVVVVAGSMMLMPGLPKVPQAAKLDVDDRGEIVGMNY